MNRTGTTQQSSWTFQDVSTSQDPRKIACTLKYSVLHTSRRKGTPYPSAMSILNFYVNRAGKNLKKTGTNSGKR